MPRKGGIRCSEDIWRALGSVVFQYDNRGSNRKIVLHLHTYTFNEKNVTTKIITGMDRKNILLVCHPGMEDDLLTLYRMSSVVKL